ncbi:unnamed protein product [Phytophthora fragariaefolia]|uniref:Unnamed protein product n=1 Tax=Phytophthora fragariaefolia TaxID=1490495 RepID=A0A9W6YFW4_9STRA|nr:unnamed protein product [Phytophthora fragariaefolia]
MFPNFTSLAQREQKRQELLERAQRRVRQAKAKREMYLGASWATDIANGITTAPSKTTATTQTDSTSEPSESLKKRLIDEYSQTNPEVSTPTMVDAEPTAKPDTNHAGTQARSSLVDVKFGEDEKPADENLFSDENSDEIEEQKRSKQAVADIYEVYPILAELGIHPLASNGRQLTKYYIGNGAKTYSIRLKKLVLVPNNDWSETYDHIRVVLTNGVRFHNYINETRERDEMGKYDNTPNRCGNILDQKGKRVNASEGDIADRTKQRLEDSFLFDNSTSTASDQSDSKLKLFWTISKNKGLLESNGLRKKIVTILNGPPIHHLLMKMVIQLIMLNPKYYFGEPSGSRPLNIRNGEHKQVSGEAWKGLMKSIRWMDTFLLLLDGFEDLDRYLKDVEYPFPSSDEEAAELVVEKKLNKQRRKTLDDNLKILHDDSEAAFQAYGEAQKRFEEAKKVVKGSNSKTARSALKAATSAMKATKAVYSAKSKQYTQALPGKTDVEDFNDRQDQRRVKGVNGSGLKGRGLRGAGVAPLEGTVRRGRTYNLNEIQSLATPSA